MDQSISNTSFLLDFKLCNNTLRFILTLIRRKMVPRDKYLHVSESFSFNIGEKHLLKDYFYFEK